MRRLLGTLLVAGLMIPVAPDAESHDGFAAFGYAAYAPDYYYGFAAPTYHPAPFAPVHYGGWGSGWGGWAYPGYLSGVRYGYSYYSHFPTYSFSYYRGPVPRYYPGPYGNSPFGGIGHYGYGPYGW